MMKKRKKTVIVNKRRFTAFLTMLLILTCCGFSSVRNHAASAEDMQYILVHVKPGDTLWSIAKSNNSGKKNTRSLVYDIQKCNKLNGSTIHVGDELVIPL